MTGYDDLDFFTDPDIGNDPFPYYSHLRSQCPVVHLPTHDVYAITSYDEMAEVLRDAETFSSANAVGGPFPGFTTQHEDGDDWSEFIDRHRGELPMSEYVVALDPPEHAKQRYLTMRLLTPKRMREQEPYMVALADGQLDDIVGGDGTLEVLKGFGYPFALMVIANLLGVPDEDREDFRRNLGGLPQSDAGEAEAMAADPLQYLNERFTEYVETRRADPGDDVLSKLANATNADGTLPTVHDVVHMALFLFAAGQDTTARLITAALQIIAEDADVQAALRADPGKIPNFVEEVLRHQGVVKAAGRLARTDVTVGGVTIPAGATVGLFPQAANRDPARFDDPDRFDLDRPNANDHLAFGRGIHACAGAPLARVEARVAIERFLARTATIEIDEDHHGPAGARRFAYEPIYILHGLGALHLRVTPA